MHIIFDYDGTIAKPEVAKRAALMRNSIIGLDQSEMALRQHMKTDSHFDMIRVHLKQQTGIEDKRYLTAMMTDIFRYCYHVVVNDMGEEILYPGMKSVLEKLAEDHTLTIASTLRQDLLYHSLERVGIRNLFAGIYANNAELDYSKSDLIKQAIKAQGPASWMVGDKMDDVVSGRENGTKTAFVHWGAGELVDFIPEVIAYRTGDLLKMD